MKKIFLTFGALGMALAVMPIFAAFEAHVVNVTATIENALSVPIETQGLTFGEIFPEEIASTTFSMGLSSSFLDKNNTNANEVDYVIRQKPKCGLPNPGSNPTTYSQFAQVTENASGTFACPERYVPLPLLCPFLSKHPVYATSSIQNDGSLDAFHGPLTGWNASTSAEFQVPGILLSNGDATDTWNIDLHAPCFQGSCAQDNIVPANYQVSSTLEHQEFGCDLWIEVTNITSTSTL